jgi:hypothetical protein
MVSGRTKPIESYWEGAIEMATSARATTSPLKHRLRELVPLDLPGFRAVVPAGTVQQRAFGPRSTEAWFHEFEEGIRSSIGHRYTPVYRMADGEFIFCVGRRCPAFLSESSRLRRAYKRAHFHLGTARDLVVNRALRNCWGESYSLRERAAMMPDYVQWLRTISGTGFLALHFTKRDDAFAEEYFPAVADWFDEKGICLASDNYLPFYFVYALLADAERTGLFTGRRVLVVTHQSGQRFPSIDQGLRAMGARAVRFVEISAGRSFFDRIPAHEFVPDADIVLVGAGVGAANILCQCQDLKTVSIDAGFFLDTLLNRDLRGQRLFTRTDQEVMNADDC